MLKAKMKQTQWKTISLGCDHARYEYKELVKEYLTAKGYSVRDFGTFSKDACDYPDFIMPAAQAVVAGQADAGIVFGGSGNGEAIVANKVRGVRSAGVRKRPGWPRLTTTPTSSQSGSGWCHRKSFCG